MPADASIYNMLRPPQAGPGPLEQFGQAMQIRNMMGQGETQALQQQQIKQQMADAPAAQARARDEESLKADKEFFTAMTPKMRDMLAGVRDDQSLAGYRDSAIKFAGMFRSPQYREMLMAGAQQIPQRFDPAWWEQNLRTADQVVSGMEAQRGRDVTVRGQDLTAGTAAAGQAQAAREGALNRGVTTRGQDLADQRARDAAAAAAAKEKAPSDTENVSAGYAARMRNSAQILGELEKAGVGKPELKETALSAVGSKMGANLSMSPDRQKFRQAQEDWVRAKLRKESGAVIADEEMDREIRVYFPQIGDDPGTVAQKADSRKQAEISMAQAAGKAKIPDPVSQPGQTAAGRIGPSRAEIDAELRRRGVIR